MKIIFILLAIIMFNKDCEQIKAVDKSQESMNSEKMAVVNQHYSQVWYEATTRGFYEKIWVTKGSITIVTDRNSKTGDTYPILTSDWNALMKLLEDVNIDELPNLVAPTSNRYHDGAAIATFAVSRNDVETISENFDHGNPPKAIEAVVNKVLSMNETYGKN